MLASNIKRERGLRSLVLVAHGSRQRASNEEILTLVDRLKKQVGGAFFSIVAGFLECAQPSIAEAIGSVVEAMEAVEGTARVGSDPAQLYAMHTILIFPYFLAKGTHVREDIPRIVEEVSLKHPEIQIKLLPYLGEHAALLESIIDQLGDTQSV